MQLIDFPKATFEKTTMSVLLFREEHMEVFGDLKLEVSDLFAAQSNLQSDMSMSLAIQFMLTGLKGAHLKLDVEGANQFTSFSVGEAIVASFNMAHGVELILKIVLRAVGEKVDDVHNIKTLYYKLERREPKLMQNFKAAALVIGEPELVVKRKKTLEILQANYQRMRYFSTGDANAVTLPDPMAMLFLCLVLCGTFAPNHFPALLRSFGEAATQHIAG